SSWPGALACTANNSATRWRIPPGSTGTAIRVSTGRRDCPACVTGCSRPPPVTAPSASGCPAANPPWAGGKYTATACCGCWPCLNVRVPEVGPLWQVSRGGTLWLLLAVVVTAAPLFRYLPPWVPLVPLLAVLWRLGIYRARWGVPPPAAKVVLILLCIGGLLASFKGLLGLEPMVAMLVCAFSLKLLEIHSRRDALVVIYLAYFVAITLALFSQSFLTGLYISTALVMVTAALAGIHQDDSAHQPWRRLLTAAAMV